jgi:prepilin-type N-terminal cleavage/methylation domain-containing protein
MNDEHGFTLIELIVGASVSLILLGSVMAMVQVATHGQDRVAARVAANQKGRPAMTKMTDRLHAACVSPGLAPVQAGSTGESMILLSKTGSDVSPTPDRYVVSLSGGVLTEVAYPATGGQPPDWTFSETPSSSQQLLDRVAPAEVGNPAATVPLFRYFAYEGGEVAPEPLPTPLSEEDAARTVQVDIAFTVAPNGIGSADPETPVALTDSATLRIEPASEDSAEVNLPCV